MQAYKTDATFFLLKSLTNVIFKGVTAEDLEEHAGDGYTAGRVIDRSGMARVFERERTGKDGCRIYTVD